MQKIKILLLNLKINKVLWDFRYYSNLKKLKICQVNFNPKISMNSEIQYCNPENKSCAKKKIKKYKIIVQTEMISEKLYSRKIPLVHFIHLKI